MLPELGVLTRANINATPGREATANILAKNMLVTSSLRQTGLACVPDTWDHTSERKMSPGKLSVLVELSQ